MKHTRKQKIKSGHKARFHVFMTHTHRSALEMSGFKMRQHGISERVRSISVSAIKEMMVLAQKYPNAISLAQGTPDFSIPAHIVRGIKKDLDHDPLLGKYAVPFSGIAPLREAIAEKLKISRGIDVNPAKEICVAVGAMEAVASAILTVVSPGDEVILISPFFPSYTAQVLLAGGIPVYAPMNENGGWHFDPASVASRITKKTRALIIGSPSNPTGYVFSKEDVQALADLACAHDFWIITDEPYDFLVYDERPFFSAVRIPDIKDRLIAGFSFSKEYALSGFRVGYVYSQEEVINQMVKVHDAFVVTASTISQRAALYALQGSQDDVQYFRREYQKRRDVMCECLSTLDDLFEAYKPHGAYYIFPKIKIPLDDYEFSIRLLKEAHVVVVPGSAFGPNGSGHVRLCFCVSEDDITEGMRRIQEWWRKEKE